MGCGTRSGLWQRRRSRRWRTSRRRSGFEAARDESFSILILKDNVSVRIDVCHKWLGAFVGRELHVSDSFEERAGQVELLLDCLRAVFTDIPGALAIAHYGQTAGKVFGKFEARRNHDLS